MGMERRGCLIQLYGLVNQKWEEPVNKAKPFEISKWVVWKAFRVTNAASLASLAGYSAVDAVLLDSYSSASRGGTGRTFDWSLVGEAKKPGRPVILSGGLTPANVREAVAIARPDGVDVSSGVEISPGRKDHEKIKEFMRECRQEAV